MAQVVVGCSHGNEDPGVMGFVGDGATVFTY
jgi:hypothetical protein